MTEADYECTNMLHPNVVGIIYGEYNDAELRVLLMIIAQNRNKIIDCLRSVKKRKKCSIIDLSEMTILYL
jgi:hypothetical protein